MNELHLTLYSIRGERGLIFRNVNTFGLSASTTPPHKLYFCSQTLTVIVKTMVMSKWAPVNPLSNRGQALFLEMEILSDCLLTPHPQTQTLFIVSNIG